MFLSLFAVERHEFCKAWRGGTTMTGRTTAAEIARIPVACPGNSAKITCTLAPLDHSASDLVFKVGCHRSSF